MTAAAPRRLRAVTFPVGLTTVLNPVGVTCTSHRPVSQARNRSAATSWVGTCVDRYDAVLVGTTST